LRVEVRLGRNELRERGLRCLEAWTRATCSVMWREKVQMLSFNETVIDEIADLANLPDHLRGTYAQWKLGHDLRKAMKTAKFYRHRTAIKAITGVDIAILPASAATPNVVPIKRVLEARLAERPDWADLVDEQLRAAGAHTFAAAA
jgi:II/X family phage/plasmid replication protein